MYRYSKHNTGVRFGGMANYETYSGYMVLNETQNHVLQQELFKILDILELMLASIDKIIDKYKTE